MPPTPALAPDTEREAFVHDATAHRLPGAVAEAASAVLCKGFHFDSFQKIPVAHGAAPAPSDPTTPVATVSYRIQVLDDQN